MRKLINTLFPFILAIILHLMILLIYSGSQDLQQSKDTIVPSKAPVTSKNLRTFNLEMMEFKKNSKSNNARHKINSTQIPQLENKSGSKENQTTINNPAEEYVVNFIHFSDPPYPKVARIKGLTGSVQIKVLFNQLGRFESHTVLQSSGHEILDNSVIESAKSWIINSQTSKKIVIKTFVFQLK